jgi:hypothetical protein
LIFSVDDNVDEFGRKFFELYNTLLGNFDGVMDKNTYEKAIFVIATYCLFLILINLIIAYMSDSYKTVMENLHQRDNKEINT